MVLGILNSCIMCKSTIDVILLKQVALLICAKMLHRISMSGGAPTPSHELVASQLQLMPILVVIMFGDNQLVISILPLELLVICT